MNSITYLPAGRVLNDQTPQDHNLHRCEGVHHRLWAQTHCWRHPEENTWRPEALQSMPSHHLDLTVSSEMFLSFWKKNYCGFPTIQSLQTQFKQILRNKSLKGVEGVCDLLHLLSPRMTSCWKTVKPLVTVDLQTKLPDHKLQPQWVWPSASMVCAVW